VERGDSRCGTVRVGEDGGRCDRNVGDAVLVEQFAQLADLAQGERLEIAGSWVAGHDDDLVHLAVQIALFHGHGQRSPELAALGARFAPRRKLRRCAASQPVPEDRKVQRTYRGT
jgi:hypothetical protein